MRKILTDARDLRAGSGLVALMAVVASLATGCSVEPRGVPGTGLGGALAPLPATAASTAAPSRAVTPSPAPLPTLLVENDPALLATEPAEPAAWTSTSTSVAPSPTATPTATRPTPSPTPSLLPSPLPEPTPTPSPSPPAHAPSPPTGREFATLDEFWDGKGEWILEVQDVGLPVGESDTVQRTGLEFWSYLHASYQSAGVVDSCGDPVPFPGCVTLWKSYDGGLSFILDRPVCLFPCSGCPCDAGRDHTQQQQYPRVFFDDDLAYMVYEWGAGTYLRTSTDGLRWSSEAGVAGTGQWRADSCPEAASVGDHPNIYSETEYGNCLVGGPPGIYAEGEALYVFVAWGRSPGHLGCFVGSKSSGATGLRPCGSNPLWSAENGYGPLEARGRDANPYYEFRTISSADVVRLGDHYYVAYEGVRGPSDPAVVDDQFALGFARSVGPEIDGPWEKYPQNPVIADVANNWGIGHADLVVVGPATYLYTATSQTSRGRYVLVRR